MSAASDDHDFALVRRRPSALETATPNTKRVLSGMVSEVLALEKNYIPAKRVFSVLVGGDIVHYELFALAVSQAIHEQGAVELKHCDTISELVEALNRRRFDVAFLYLHLFSEEQFHHNTSTLQDLIAVNPFITNAGSFPISFLRRIHGIPVVVLTGSGFSGEERLVIDAGANAFFHLGSYRFEALVEALRHILKPEDRQQ